MSSTSPGVPGYETINVLAEGSSTVVRARSLDDGSDVIVKLLDPASEPILPKRFDRRRRALLRLSGSDHGFIPLIEHGFATDGRPFVVVPFLPLGSLQDQLDRGPTPWFPASQLMTRVAEAVGRAHDAEAPLGDLRPSKILLQGADTPELAVFGMASRRFDDGRPSYRAPETDNDTPATAAADVFSLALILATLIAGRPKERNEPVESFLTELIGLAPARIHDVLEHGLAESVTNRYGTGAAMHRALVRAIEEGPDQRGGDDDADGSPVDIDELLHNPFPVVEEPEMAAVARTTADGLPADLGDLVLVDEVSDATKPEDEPEAGPDDHLLLPAGLDDLVLAPPSTGADQGPRGGADQNETTPFPLEDPTGGDHEADQDGTDLTIIDLTAIGSAAMADVGAGEGSDPSDHDPADPADDASHLGQDHTNDLDLDGIEAEAIGSDVEDDLTGDVDGAEGLDPDLDGGATAEDEADAEHEIVDLTELFTRTQEFVYDPEIHGPADRPGEDGRRSGDGPAPARPPGDPAGSPSITTTTLLRQTDPAGVQGETAAAPVALDGKVGTDDGSTGDPVTNDRPSLATAAAVVAPAPPQMPDRPVAPSLDHDDDDDDQTAIFPDPDEGNPPWLGGELDEAALDGTRQVLDPDRSEAIPFPNMGPVRNRVDDHRWQARARTRAELLWFRGRRTFSTVLAVLGLLAIVAIVVLFAAREIRSATTSVDTEGAPQPLTTATTGVNYLSTDAPFITDVPPSYQPTTATTARRRAATTAAPTTSSPPVTPSTRPPTTPAETTIVVTTEPPTTERPSTTERPPTTKRDSSTTERTTSTRRRRRRTTTVPTTITTEVLPTTDEDDDDDAEPDTGPGQGNGRGDNVVEPPDLSPPTLVTLTQTSATVTYSSDECVATRFRLAGTDGSVQSGASRGYEAAIQCSSAWNLDFSGSSRLTSGVGYTLTLTIKGPSGQAISSQLEFTTPA